MIKFGGGKRLIEIVYHIRPPGVKQKGCRTRKEYGSLDGFFDVLGRNAFYSAALKS